MDDNNTSLMKLTPFAAEKVWGGELLNKIKKLNAKNAVGETLEISTLKNSNSKFEGVELSKITGELSYLVKFIETTDNLSIQVHPDDEYAKEVENSLGKSECWLILDAKEDSGIYLGFKSGVTKDDLYEAIKQNKPVNELLQFYPVKRGDFFFVPAGAIHAIGANVLLAEVQQNCGVTYRVWDWNRVGLDGLPRQLHLEKALDVIEFSAEKNNSSYFNYQRNVFVNHNPVLANHADFNFKIINDASEISLLGEKPNGILNFSKGRIKLSSSSEEIELDYLEAALALANIENIQVKGDEILLGLVY